MEEFGRVPGKCRIRASKKKLSGLVPKNSHYSFLFGTCGLRYSIPPIHSDFISLRRYHFLPLFLITFETLGTMFNLVGGRVEKVSFF